MESDSPDSGNLIEAPALAARLQASDCLVFDCRFDLLRTERGREAYLAGHIPTAVYAHLDDDLSAPRTGRNGRHPLPEPAVLADWLGRHGLVADRPVVVYDDTGGAIATRLWWMLHWLGHHRVRLLNGGFQAWTAAGLPLEAGPVRPDAGAFIARPARELWVDAPTIAARPPALLLDVRTAERFRGEHEPIDPVAGHIPGAVNLPLQRNLGEDGRFLEPAELRALYAPLLPAGDAGEAVCYCGSGVTACHGILALREAGFGMARLYPGSWSEWIADPRRPVATGD